MGARRFFGEQVLVQNGGVRTATVRAKGLVRVLRLQRGPTEALIAKHPAIRDAFQAAESRYKRSTLAREAGGASSGGVGEGSRTEHKVVIQSDGTLIDMVPLPLWFEATGWRRRLGGQQTTFALSVVMGLVGTVFSVMMWWRSRCPGSFLRFYFFSLASVSTARKGNFRIRASETLSPFSIAGDCWCMQVQTMVCHPR